MVYEFLIPKRPVSLQTKNRGNLQAWKQYVRGIAAQKWKQSPLQGMDLQLTLVYLYDTDPVDVDNIIKPIQDALVGLVYEDDLIVTDVESRRRFLVGTFDLTRCPADLINGIANGVECVFVRVSAPRLLEDCI